MNQCQRVLRALRRHPDGVTQVDFLLPNTIDGGAPITRVAARVRDLRERGHEIVVEGERYGCAVYRLPTAPRVELAKPVVERPKLEASDDTLFPAPRTPSHSPYSVDDAA